MQMHDYPEVTPHDQASTIELLQSLKSSKSPKDRQTLHIEHGNQRYMAPLKLTELADLIAEHPQARLLAGGTDVGLEITKQHRHLEQIIYLGQVEELLHIEQTDDQLSIGAAVTLTDAIPVIVQHFPGFAELMTRFASLPIRNTATLGGNIANGSPIGDSMPALIVVGTKLRLRTRTQTRDLALQDYYVDYGKTALQPGEFIEQILIPLSPNLDVMRIAAFKVSKRFDQDISAVCGAYCLQLNQDSNVVEAIQIAYGGLATTPRRALHCETALLGKVWNETTVDAAMGELLNDFMPISDMRASAEYRQRTAANLLRRFFITTNGYPAQTQETNVYDYGR